MYSLLRLTAAVACLAASCAAARAPPPPPIIPKGKIKHVVVLLEENRSFDHLFGHNKQLLKNGANVLKGTESIPKNLSEPQGARVKPFDGAPYVATIDPNHGFPAYNVKIFGNTSFNPRRKTASECDNDCIAQMNGFYDFEITAHHNSTDAGYVMQGFTPSDLPITSLLAEEFAVFDSWYAAFPGPSWPNHLYSITATSAGCTMTGDHYQCKAPSGDPASNSSLLQHLYPQKTIFESLQDAGFDWMNVYNDSKHELYVKYMSTPTAAAHTHNMDEFFHRARMGTLPALTWIGPREGVNASLGPLGNPNSDHPSCCDVALGERLRKDIYEALRGGPGWNDTAFIFTWDDPGGLYDHVKPPGTGSAPPPDDVKFNRLGSRLPVVLVSPWIKKGTVIHSPAEHGDGPTPTSQYDSSSICASIKNLFGLPSFLTKRDAWSGSFHKFFGDRGKMSAPRTDAPLHLPAAPEPYAVMKARLKKEGKWKTSPQRAARRAVRRRRFLREDDDDDDDEQDDDECDDPTRRMRRSIRLFESINGVTAPKELHDCAHAEPYWLNSCAPGTMLTASKWLAQQTAAWKQQHSQTAADGKLEEPTLPEWRGDAAERVWHPPEL